MFIPFLKFNLIYLNLNRVFFKLTKEQKMYITIIINQQQNYK